MPDKKLGSATARVRFEIDVPAGSSWGSDCSLQQIYDQAGNETLAKLRGVLNTNLPGSRIIGEPKVTAVSVVENK